MDNLPTGKNSDGHHKSILTVGDLEGVTTTRDKATEIWSLLEYYYKIKSTRDEFLTRLGITDTDVLEKVSRSFESYITQAKNFYYYAQNSDYRSAALLYYYSYLNLAKASIVLKHPNLADKSLYHGIKEAKDVESFENMASNTSAQRNGVLKLLYKDRFQKPLPSTATFKLKDMLAYTEEVSHEYSQATGIQNRLGNLRYAVAFDRSRKKCWSVVAIRGWGIFNDYPKSTKVFNAEFTKIRPPVLVTDSAFSISGMQRLYYDFFESNIEYDFLGTDSLNTFACDDQMNRATSNLYQSEILDDTVACKLAQPLNQDTELRMDETIAAYIVMHRLSEVVRYHPDLFMGILGDNTKEGWLVKNFIEVSSYNFLVRMASAITDKHYLILRN